MDSKPQDADQKQALPTPGPWRIGEKGIIGNPSIIADTPGIRNIAIIAICPEQDANARLVAAAPDLLEACKTVLPEIELDARHSFEEQALLEIADQLRRAISKAEGRDA